MAGMMQRIADQAERPRLSDDIEQSGREDRLSNGGNKVVRLPRAPDASKPVLADKETRRQRMTAILTEIVERAVVPRLLSARGIEQQPALIMPPAQHPAPEDAPTQDAVISFTDTLLKGAPGAAADAVETLRRSGIAAETISLHLLTGAARHLGYLWEEDIISFAEVSVATGQLQEIFRTLAPSIEVRAEAPGLPRAALLLSTPGEQHSFGLSMLAAFFRNAGWTVQTPRIRNAGDVQRQVATTPFEMLGFSLGAEVHTTRLGRCIEIARRASCNRNLVILVGGPVFVARPELAALIGADATALDAPTALAAAERLIRTRRG